MKLELTLRRLPVNGMDRLKLLIAVLLGADLRLPLAGALKDACGVPFGFVLQPYANSNALHGSTTQELIPAAALARCRHCYA